jgi:hypothetical protein
MTKREEYLAAKKLATELRAKEIADRNFIYQEEQRAERLSDPLREAWVAARDADVRRCRIQLREKVAALKTLQEELHAAERRFNTMHYECDHYYENGQPAIATEYGFGCDPGDKPTVKCGICGESWK